MVHIKKKKSEKKKKNSNQDLQTPSPIFLFTLLSYPYDIASLALSNPRRKKKKKSLFVRLPCYLELWSINVKRIIFQAFFILIIHLLEVGHSFMSLSFSLN